MTVLELRVKKTLLSRASFLLVRTGTRTHKLMTNLLDLCNFVPICRTLDLLPSPLGP